MLTTDLPQGRFFCGKNMKPENIELNKTKLDELHRGLLTSGLAYEYGNERLHLVPPEPHVIGSHNLGLDHQRVTDIQTAHSQWLEVAYSTLVTTEGKTLVQSLLSKEDQAKLEFDYFCPTRPLYGVDGYISNAHLTRIDHLYNGQGEVLGCDPNLIPLGFAYVYAYSNGINQLLENEPLLGDIIIYENRLADALSNEEGKISGVVTSTKYPLWRMHLYTTNLLRQNHGVPAYVIPPEAVDSKTGEIDTRVVKDLYEELGLRIPTLDPKMQAETLIRYCREIHSLENPDLRVVNPAGLRVMESQLWNGLINLPGYDSYYKKLTGREIDLPLHQRNYIRSALARVTIFQVQIATEIDENGNITWEDDLRNLPGYSDLDKVKGQRPNYQGYLKTFSTSGNKGARKFGEQHGSIAESAHRCYVSIHHLSPPSDGEIMLVQPYVHSVSRLYGDSNDQSHRIDVYISGEDHHLVAAASCNTPYPEKAHGGSNATYGLIYDTQKLYPDYDPSSDKQLDPDRQPLNGVDIREALGIDGGPVIGTILGRLKTACQDQNYSRGKYTDILGQLKMQLEQKGVVITMKRNSQTEQTILEVLDNLMKA